MAAAALEAPLSTIEPAVRAGPPGPQLVSSEAIPVASHVHDLQDLLARRLDAPAPAKWSARATVGFVMLVCGALWAGVFLAIGLLIH